jgi:hypothetical protein
MPLAKRIGGNAPRPFFAYSFSGQLISSMVVCCILTKTDRFAYGSTVATTLENFVTRLIVKTCSS